MSTVALFKEAWKNRDKLGDANQSRELSAFLPAALEIQEAPPNPAARWLAWSLLLLMVLAIAWASFGYVNIVASAEGKIIPSSRVKQIQPLEKGVVKTIFVSEGEYVTEGQPLIELDTTLTQANKNSYESELYRLQLNLAVNQALARLFERNQPSYSLAMLKQEIIPFPDNTNADDAALYTRLFQQQWLQYQSQLQALRSSLVQNQSEQNTTEEIIKKLEQTLPIATHRTEKLQTLYNHNFASEEEYLAAEQERIQQSQDLAAQRHALQQLKDAVSEINEQINLHSAQFSGTLYRDITELKRQMSTQQEELIKADDLNAKRILYAPVAGKVQELAVNTIGGVVTDAQQLMLIVPADEHLEVEVFLNNNDIGFVNEGMAAEVKVHTFPFTKYGIIDADVTSVSNDAIVDEQKGLIYRMLLRMNKNTLLVDGKEVNLQPGMAVTAEVQTGERRIIEFFLAPLLRHKQEALRER